MKSADWLEIESRFDRLSQENKLLVIERLIRRVRRGSSVEDLAAEREMIEMANDPAIRREMGEMIEEVPASDRKEEQRNAAG